MELKQLRECVKQLMKESRYLHSRGVEEVSYDLALIYGCDTRKASIAGILHDYAKGLSDEELLAKCDQYHLPITEVERKRPVLLHAKVGSAMVKDLLGVEDEDILNSITYHTTGRPSMSLLEKIIFTADFIEPYRKPIPNIDEIRRWAYLNLDTAVTMILKNTLDYLTDSGVLIDTLTKETYEYYKALTQVD